jgi:ligand-binding sensor domain-containing protein
MPVFKNLFKAFVTFFSLLLLVSAFPLQAQDTYLKFDHLTVDNGLPQNSVYSIVEDRYGFMWFATWGGAVRYDGYSVKVFRADDNDTTALSDNRINVIVTDSLHNIWIETGNAKYLYKYNYEYENFSRYPFNHAPACVIKSFRWWDTKAEIEAQKSFYTFTTDRHGFR